MVHSKHTITVIIATKNRVELLKSRSLKSVYNQSISPNKVIVIDDSDSEHIKIENQDLIKLLREQSKIEIEYIVNQRTEGAAGSWNSGVDYILSENIIPETSFIAILDDDDEWHSDYLKKCNEHIQQKSLDMIACDFNRITDNETIINTAPNKLLVNDFLIRNPGIQGSNIFVRLSIFLEAGCFDENIKSSTDRDLCIRITDLGSINYERIPEPLMNHYAESNRVRMSTPNTEIKNLGLQNFWRKHSKRMTSTQKEKYLTRAKKLFNWELKKDLTFRNEIKLQDIGSKSNFSLLVGVICSKHKTIIPLLQQLQKLSNELFLDNIEVILLENDLSINDKNIIKKEVTSLNIIFITKEQQDKWIASIDYFKHYSRKNKLLSIAQARTLLQKYVGKLMLKTPENIAWILDEDMQITEDTVNALKILPQLKNKGIDIAIGKYEHASPNPPINGIRTQLVDFWYNLNWILNKGNPDKLPDFSIENNLLKDLYPDYYYDLSRKHTGHLEHPFWITHNLKSESILDKVKYLTDKVNGIFNGNPFTRPLETRHTKNIIDSIKDSVNRGGTTFIFNPKALNSTPNLDIKMNGTDIRRSDMLWAIINKHYRKMIIKSINIPIFHAGKEIEKQPILDVNKLREEILGSCLYAGIIHFLKARENHTLSFSASEVTEITHNIEKSICQRMILLKYSFYRSRGISRSLKNLDIHSNNESLNKITQNIDSFFSKENFQLIEKNTKKILFSTFASSLKSFQEQADKFNKTIIINETE